MAIIMLFKTLLIKYHPQHKHYNHTHIRNTAQRKGVTRNTTKRASRTSTYFLILTDTPYLMSYKTIWKTLKASKKALRNFFEIFLKTNSQQLGVLYRRQRF